MNEQDFEREVLKNKDKMYRFALSFLKNTTEAQDIVQEIFLKLWQTRFEIREKRNIEAWSMTLVRNKCIDLLKSTARSSRSNLDISSLGAAVNESPSPYQITVLRETLSRVDCILDELSEKQRSAFKLRDIEGFSYTEIGDVLNMDINQVKVNIFRARKTIKSKLEMLESHGQ